MRLVRPESMQPRITSRSPRRRIMVTYRARKIRNARHRGMFTSCAFAAMSSRMHGIHHKKEHCMRKTFITLSAISAIALVAMPASARDASRSSCILIRRPCLLPRQQPASPPAPCSALGLTQAWWGTSGAAAALPVSAAGAAAAGGVAGVGTIAHDRCGDTAVPRLPRLVQPVRQRGRPVGLRQR